MKKLRFLFGAVTGALMQYLFDPVAGQSRRARVGKQAMAYMGEVRREIGRRTRGQGEGQTGDGSASVSDWRTPRPHVSSEQPFPIDDAPRIV